MTDPRRATEAAMTTNQRWTMVAAILGSSIVFLDGLVVAVALPSIGRDLPTSYVGVLEGQTYVTAGYFAMLAAFLILGGALSDHYGRRRVFTIGLVGFGVTSLLCGLAPTLELLVVGRLLQGASGALLVPGSLAIITATFDRPQRARAFGIWAAATSATNLLGPILGGALVGITWRAAFLVNVPLLLVALWATRRYMAESRDDNASERFDWLGALVGAIAVGGLAFGAIRGQQREWNDPVAFVALGVGAAAAVAFPILMVRRPDPLVPLGLFRSRRFATVNLSTFLIYGALYSVLGFQSVYLQGTLGYSPLAAGSVTIPLAILLTVLSTRVGALAGRLGPRRFLVIGPSLMAIGTLWFARIPSTSPAWPAQLTDPASLAPPVGTLVDVLPYVLLFGTGLAFVVAPLTTTLMGSIPVQRAGLGSAVNNAISRVGQPLLGALLFVAITSVFYSTIGELVPGIDTDSPAFRAAVAPLNEPSPGVPPEVVAASDIASTDAFRIALIVSAGLLAAGAVVNDVGLRPEDEGVDAREPLTPVRIEA
jgi:EmrB/QacA subfamily drug resistance transporter